MRKLSKRAPPKILQTMTDISENVLFTYIYIYVTNGKTLFKWKKLKRIEKKIQCINMHHPCIKYRDVQILHTRDILKW